MLIDWLWLVQTQSGQAGFQGRQLCIGAWTLLSPKPEVMVVPDCVTDFRYTEPHCLQTPHMCTRAPLVLTVQPCCVIQLHQHSGANAHNAWVDMSSLLSCSLLTTSVCAVRNICSPPLLPCRLQHHPMVVKEPGLRFYAAAPLVLSNGFCAGSM